MMAQGHLRYSDEERAWFGRTLPGEQVKGEDGRWTTPAPELVECGAALVPAKGLKLTPEFVTGLSASAQWSYKANSSTRGAKVKPAAARKARPAASKPAPSAALVLEVEQLRARVRELEQDNQRLGRLLAARGRRTVASVELVADQAALAV